MQLNLLYTVLILLGLNELQAFNPFTAVRNAASGERLCQPDLVDKIEQGLPTYKQWHNNPHAHVVHGSNANLKQSQDFEKQMQLLVKCVGNGSRDNHHNHLLAEKLAKNHPLLTKELTGLCHNDKQFNQMFHPQCTIAMLAESVVNHKSGKSAVKGKNANLKQTKGTKQTNSKARNTKGKNANKQKRKNPNAQGKQQAAKRNSNSHQRNSGRRTPIANDEEIDDEAVAEEEDDSGSFSEMFNQEPDDLSDSEGEPTAPQMLQQQMPMQQPQQWSQYPAPLGQMPQGEMPQQQMPYGQMGYYPQQQQMYPPQEWSQPPYGYQQPPQYGYAY